DDAVRALRRPSSGQDLARQSFRVTLHDGPVGGVRVAHLLIALGRRIVTRRSTVCHRSLNMEGPSPHRTARATPTASPLAMAPSDNSPPPETVQFLVAGWCDRRCLKALRAILAGYPLTSPLTDGWGDLLRALQDVRAFAGDDLTEAERTA